MSRQLAFSSTISVMVMAAFALSTAATAYARDAAPRAHAKVVATSTR
jgi:hypothetical protein